MNWYIVQAYSGFEKKVVETIKDELKKHKLSENLEEILVPTHQVTEVKKGKRTKKERKFFPGYVLIKIELTKQIYHLIKNLPKVSGFLGTGDKPTPISDNEIQRILGQVSESADNQKTGITFEIGEKVKVRKFVDIITEHKINRIDLIKINTVSEKSCLLYTSPSPRDGLLSRMPSSA